MNLSMTEPHGVITGGGAIDNEEYYGSSINKEVVAYICENSTASPTKIQVQ